MQNILYLFACVFFFFFLFPRANHNIPAELQEFTAMSQLFHPAEGHFPSGAVEVFNQGDVRAQGAQFPTGATPGTSSSSSLVPAGTAGLGFHHSPGKVLAGSSLMQSFLLTELFTVLEPVSCRNRDLGDCHNS